MSTPTTNRPLRIGACVLLCTISVWWWFSLPRPLFDVAWSVVVEDRSGDLLGARVAADGQWRFPPPDSVPWRFAQALIAFEDKRFYRHVGVDPIALIRACYQNLRANRIVSGGSTLSMQVIRLAGGPGARTFRRKVWEMLMALRLELGTHKEDILKLYATHAPFGGNVVGLEAASWRYFGKSPWHLSWAQAATLAVLPNAPSLIHPGRHRQLLRHKRDQLLSRLLHRGLIDTTSWQLALAEPLPQAPKPLPDLAPHLTEHLRQQYPQGGRLRTTLDVTLQQRATEQLAQHARIWSSNGVHNAAALIVDTRSGAVRAWVGNVPGCGKSHHEWVDLVTAPRSPGSTLKPLLYAWMLDRGQILPDQLLFDLPIWISGYHPQNYHRDYDGLVPARQALARSLNVPAVGLLQQAGIAPFLHQLRKWGLAHLDWPAEHYGLSLILGSGEATLYELCGIYASMGRSLWHFDSLGSHYLASDLHPPVVLAGQLYAPSAHPTDIAPMVGAAAIWHTFEAMKRVTRPDEWGNWQVFESSRPIAWKTGTSVGFRDAWAIGIDPQWTVGVWMGNADGEGRAGLLGVKAAAPLMFSLFELLPPVPQWFAPPYDDMEYAATCRKSGMLANPWCPTDTTLVPRACLQGPICPWHHLIWRDPHNGQRVTRSCAPEAIADTAFILPAWVVPWYARHHPEYEPPPPFRTDCQLDLPTDAVISIIYPPEGMRIDLPVDVDGTPQALVCRASSVRPDDVLYWMLDAQYVGRTTEWHELALRPKPGPHLLTVTNASGAQASVHFTVVDSEQ